MEPCYQFRSCLKDSKKQFALEIVRVGSECEDQLAKGVVPDGDVF